MSACGFFLFCIPFGHANQPTCRWSRQPQRAPRAHVPFTYWNLNDSRLLVNIEILLDVVHSSSYLCSICLTFTAHLRLFRSPFTSLRICCQVSQISTVGSLICKHNQIPCNPDHNLTIALLLRYLAKYHVNIECETLACTEMLAVVKHNHQTFRYQRDGAGTADRWGAELVRISHA